MRRTVERSDWATTGWVRVRAAALSCETDYSSGSLRIGTQVLTVNSALSRIAENIIRRILDLNPRRYVVMKFLQNSLLNKVLD